MLGTQVTREFSKLFIDKVSLSLILVAIMPAFTHIALAGVNTSAELAGFALEIVEFSVFFSNKASSRLTSDDVGPALTVTSLTEVDTHAVLVCNEVELSMQETAEF